MPAQKMPETPKKLYLTKAEIQNVASRKSLMEQYIYLTRLLDADLQSYVMNIVCPRLSVAKGAKVKLSDDLNYLEVVEETKKDDKK